MHLPSLLALSTPLLAATASAQYGNPHYGGDGTHFHVTDLLISANPNDNAPMVGFNVSAVHPNVTSRSFPVTECKTDMAFGTNGTDNKLMDTKTFFPCEDPSVKAYFGPNVRFNGYGTRRNGWMLDLKHNFGNGSDYDTFWKAFVKRTVKTNGTGEDAYQWLDIESDFWHVSHRSYPILRMS